MINNITSKNNLNIKTNKTFKILGNIGFVIFMTIMLVLIFITAQSKYTGKEPSLLGHRIYIVNSGSMSPTLKVDSLIIVKEIKPEEVKVEDIITYYGHDKSSRVTHRVVEVQNKGESFITKGDANEVKDPLPLEDDKLIGRVVLTIPFIGKIFNFLSTKLGIALMITIGIVWLIIPPLFKKINNKKIVE